MQASFALGVFYSGQDQTIPAFTTAPFNSAATMDPFAYEATMDPFNSTSVMDPFSSVGEM